MNRLVDMEYDFYRCNFVHAAPEILLVLVDVMAVHDGVSGLSFRHGCVGG